MRIVFKVVFLLSILSALAGVPAIADDFHSYVYMNSSAAVPWDVTSNEVDMDDVFGTGNWELKHYETANVNHLFSPSKAFIFMEGGDNNANALQTFLTNNAAAMTSWVNGGGTLFINCAPNQGSGMSLGFGVTLNFDPTAYSTGSTIGNAVNPNHAVFLGPVTPMATTFTGGDSFSHAYLTGTGLSPIIQDDQGRTTLAQMQVGSGLVVFGGLTVDIFQAPWPQAHNLRVNIIYYVASHNQNLQTQPTQ